MACGRVEENPFPDCYDSSVYNDSTPIGADPDIAGVGVISAFVVSAGLAIVISFLYILLESDSKLDQYVKKNTKWLEVLETLILTLSDQQLVTGLAILIAAFARWNEITVYHWEIVTDLAFVASSTHLCTLAVLRHSFRQPEWRWTRLWRVVTMVIFAILLFVANTYTGYRYWDDSAAWPMRCVARELRRDFRRYFRGSQATLAIVWDLFLISNYLTAILGLFENICTWTRDLLESKQKEARWSYQRLEADREEMRPSLLTKLHGLHVSACSFSLLLVSRMRSTSFFILQVLFWFLFDTIYLFKWRNANQCYLDEPGKEDDVSGFGQILPLVLLLLPFMQFIELLSSI